MKQLEKMRYFYGATWKTKMKKIEGSGALERPQVKEIEASGGLERPQVKEIEGSLRAGPSFQSSIRMSLQKWISLNVQTNGAKRRRSRSSVVRPSSEENRSEQPYGQVTMSASQERLGCVFYISSALVGWSLAWTTFLSHTTAQSLLLRRHTPRYASGAPQRRPRRSRMSRTHRRPPSSMIPD